MTSSTLLSLRLRRSLLVRALQGTLLACVALSLSCAGGNILSAAFVDLLDPSGASATVPLPSGYVIIGFVNNAEVDERLVSYLETQGLTLTDQERADLRPRVRFRLLITFSNGNATSVEFVDGSSNLIDPDFSAAAFPDLNQNDLDNSVYLCHVARVELLSTIEVFMPVQLIGYQQRITVLPSGETQVDYVQNVVIDPHFEALEVDDVDEDQNIVLERNIGIRDVLAPVNNPGCGAVVGVVMTGTLSAPFLANVDDNPSYDVGDEATVARIGGRYEFSISVR